MRVHLIRLTMEQVNREMSLLITSIVKQMIMFDGMTPKKSATMPFFKYILATPSISIDFSPFSK
jgi:hypothetical protein